jgi:nucleoid-associated protein YgaU
MFEFPVDTERAFGHHPEMARTYVRRRRATLTVVAVSLVTLLIGPVGHAFQAGAAVREPRTVVVQAGDSLWTIAHRIAPSADPRAVVDAIAASNDVRADSLRPGQRLVVPAP